MPDRIVNPGEVSTADLEALRPFLRRLADRTMTVQVKQRISPSDVVQQTFLEAYREFHGFRGTTDGDLRAWLSVILLNKTRNAYRHTRAAKRDVTRERKIPDSRAQASIKSPSSMASFQEEFFHLETALAKLPKHYREAIEYRSLQQYTFAQVAEKLGKTEDAARKIWLRALDQLRKEMGLQS